MTAIAGAVPVQVIVRRISEQLQSDAALMLKLKNIGIQPGREVTLVVGNDDVRVTRAGTGGGDLDVGVALPHDIAAHVFVAGSS
jgi:DtxR family transcriptional regulator, Mn-dependent transcriptional regulator